MAHPWRLRRACSRRLGDVRLLRKRQESGGGPIGEHLAALRIVRDPHGRRNHVEHSFQFFGARPELALGALACGDVAIDRNESRECSIRSLVRNRDHIDPHGGAIFSSQFDLDSENLAGFGSLHVLGTLFR